MILLILRCYFVSLERISLGIWFPALDAAGLRCYKLFSLLKVIVTAWGVVNIKPEAPRLWRVKISDWRGASRFGMVESLLYWKIWWRNNDAVHSRKLKELITHRS